MNALLMGHVGQSTSRSIEFLTIRQREVAILHWGEQRSLSEVERLVGISKKSVRMHLARAARRIQSRGLTVPKIHKSDWRAKRARICDPAYLADTVEA